MENYQKNYFRRTKKEGLKKLPQYRQVLTLKILMATFVTLFSLSILFALLTKLINAEVNGEGIQPQFWLGPNGEVLSLSAANCFCSVSHYFDFFSNVLIITVIPTFALLSVIFVIYFSFAKRKFDQYLMTSQNNQFFWYDASKKKKH